MTEAKLLSARASTRIHGKAEKIRDVFVEPAMFTRSEKFWLNWDSPPLFVGETVIWNYLMPRGPLETTPTKLDDDLLAWNWSDGTNVTLSIVDEGGSAIVTIIQAGFSGSLDEKIDRALAATEELTILLCDLKLFVQRDQISGLMASKIQLSRDIETA